MYVCRYAHILYIYICVDMSNCFDLCNATVVYTAHRNKHTHTHTHARTHTHRYIYIYIYIYLYVCVCVYVYTRR